MDLYQAMSERISCRAFTALNPSDDALATLREAVDKTNSETGLHLQLFGPGEGNLRLRENMFSNQAPCYLAFVGPNDDLGKEKVGYFGEKIVLLATTLGLGTCWVAGTFDRDTVEAEVGEGEFLHDVIPFGYAPAKMPMRQRAIRVGIRRRNRKLPTFLPDADYDAAPDWIRAGIEAIRMGPSAVNGQPVVLGWDGATVTARLIEHKLTLEETDLGIAKLHFELAAAAAGHPGHWEWGDGGAFVEG